MLGRGLSQRFDHEHIILSIVDRYFVLEPIDPIIGGNQIRENRVFIGHSNLGRVLVVVQLVLGDDADAVETICLVVKRAESYLGQE